MLPLFSMFFLLPAGCRGNEVSWFCEDFEWQDPRSLSHYMKKTKQNKTKSNNPAKTRIWPNKALGMNTGLGQVSALPLLAERCQANYLTSLNSASSPTNREQSEQGGK